MEEFHSKCKEYPWLTTDKDGKLLCSTCKEVSPLKIDQTQGVYIRSQWVTGGVSHSGTVCPSRRHFYGVRSMIIKTL